jgi:apolipoprotein N-acyltransferase
MRILPGRIPLAPIGAAVATGIILRFVLSLEPIWWLAWIAPVPLLIQAFTTKIPSASAWLIALAALIGSSANFGYYSRVLPLPAILVAVPGQVMLWVFVVGSARRIVLAYQSWWTVFAYPVLWVTVDMLMAALLPDGNWASLAYSQAEVLPLLQVTSLFGIAGLLFLLALIPSALALALVFGSRLHRAPWAYATPLVLLAAAVGYGQTRLQQGGAAGADVMFGVMAIDDAIGRHASRASAESIWTGYEGQVASMAAQGARVIVLPEKIALLAPREAEQTQRRLAALAARHHVWIEAGMGIDDGRQRRNVAWLFSPEGALAADYQKHFMAPPERGFAKGTAYSVPAIDGAAYGMAICKDMHFAVLGRAYGQRQVAVMLVPAWDFRLDRWMASRITLTRGVENGYPVVRASREGLLTVSDGFGRVLAERRSAALPGAAMLVTLRVGAPQATLYKRIGDAFGWLCVAAGVVLVGIGRRGE